MIAYVFIGIKLADIINMENNENNGKYDDYPFPAGRMTRKNGFVLLVLIEAVIDMLLMRCSNRNVIMTGIIIGS